MLECLHLISLCDRMSSYSAHMLILCAWGCLPTNSKVKAGVCVGDCASAAFACVSLSAFKYMQGCAQLSSECVAAKTGSQHDVL